MAIENGSLMSVKKLDDKQEKLSMFLTWSLDRPDALGFSILAKHAEKY